MRNLLDIVQEIEGAATYVQTQSAEEFDEIRQMIQEKRAEVEVQARKAILDCNTNGDLFLSKTEAAKYFEEKNKM